MFHARFLQSAGRHADARPTGDIWAMGTIAVNPGELLRILFGHMPMAWEMQRILS